MLDMKQKFINEVRDEEYLFKLLNKSDKEIKDRIEEIRLDYLIFTKREINRGISRFESSIVRDTIDLLKKSVTIQSNIDFLELINIEQNKEIIDFCVKQRVKEKYLYKSLNRKFKRDESEDEFDNMMLYIENC